MQREPAQIIWIRLDQNWNLQSGKLDRVGNALFIAKVGQYHQDAVDLLSVLVKECSALLRILPGLDAAELRRLLVENDMLDPALRKHLNDILTTLSDQSVRKKIAVANNNTKRN